MVAPLPAHQDAQLAAVLPRTIWWKSPHLRRVNFCVLTLAIFSSSNGFDGSLINGLEALPSWVDFMGNPSSTWLGFINAIYWIGALVSTSLAAWVGNKFGRRLCIWISIALMVIGTILGTAAPSATVYTISRVILGMGMGWVSNSAPLLLNEISYPAHRGVASALFMTGYYLGAVISAWATFATRSYTDSWSWRLPTLLQALLPIVAIPGFLTVPESPRWLISRGRLDEARQVLANLHAGGNTTAPLIDHEMHDIQGTLAAEAASNESQGYRDMIRTPGNRHRLFITVTLGIFAQWSGNGVVSYYLSMVLDTVGITQTKDQLLISACLQIWNLLFAVSGASIVEWCGRRPLFLTSASVMLVSYTIITGLSGSFAQTNSGPTGTAVIPFLFIYFAGYNMALNPMLTAYPCEIWPYSLRSRGLNVAWLSSIGGTVFNTFVNPIALAAIGWKYYFVFVAVLMCYGATAALFYPETKGYSLEHIARIFDGDDAAVATSHPVGKDDEDGKGPAAVEAENV